MMEIKLEKFQGPLGLLLKLIEKEELDITEIGLAAICDQYIAYIENNRQIKTEEMADFLYVAAKLLYIKSKALLPYLYSEDEEAEIDDFKLQLRMYKEFVKATENVREMTSGKRFLFVKNINQKQIRKQLLANASFIAPDNVDKNRLKQVFADFLKSLQPKIEKLKEEKIKRVVTIEERIDYIKNILDKKHKYNFNKLISGSQDKTEIIVNFLAILELAKQRQLVFKQVSLFGEIDIFKN
ncbi:MAG: segregation/condensation protein A [Candidatus Pacebacteria bacterium]|nr:segregation/condensation protein A [Candidatus Paceibacterota bacterium]